MFELKHKTADNEDLKFLPKVYFTCHRDDYEANFEKITDCILELYNCDICYTETMDDSYGNDRDVLLGEMNLFVFPVTKKTLVTAKPRDRRGFDVCIRKEDTRVAYCSRCSHGN